ncbi:MAG TPA: hypothetical protein VIJ25_13810 [Methylococcales bacterium]
MRPNPDEKSGLDLHCADVRRRSFRRKSVDRHAEPPLVSAGLVERHHIIDGTHDARSE